ncbi:MAG TPA: hypothetical protein PKY87_08110 [Terricaulis sp.]|nr:hypothetical protein [Terricaulis sp.]
MAAVTGQGTGATPNVGDLWIDTSSISREVWVWGGREEGWG